MSEQLTLVARISPKPEYFEVARQAVLGIIRATRAEPGCIEFVLHKEREGGGQLYLYEVWASEGALAAHHDEPYTKAIFHSYREWLSEPVEIKMLRRIE